MAKTNGDTTTFNKYGFKYPAADKIGSRTSTVARSMASTLMPRIKGVDDQNDMGIWSKESVICCAYCGGKANHVDHLFPLVEGKYPSGYYSNPENLVPCCGDCNQSKGAKSWEEYMDILNYITKENLIKYSCTDENLLNEIYSDKELLEKTLNNISMSKDYDSLRSLLNNIEFRKAYCDLLDSPNKELLNLLKDKLNDLLKISEKSLEYILKSISNENLKTILTALPKNELKELLKMKKLAKLLGQKNIDQCDFSEDQLIDVLSNDKLINVLNVSELKRKLTTLPCDILLEVLTDLSNVKLISLLKLGELEKVLVDLPKESLKKVLICLTENQLKKVLKGKELIKKLLEKELETPESLKNRLKPCLESLVDVKNTKKIKQKEDELSVSNRNLLINFLKRYLFYIINLEPNKRHSKEKILVRLLNPKTKEESQVVEALINLNSRKVKLENYCNQKKFDNKDSVSNQNRLNYFDENINPEMSNIKEWWDNMYNAIKESLDSAQIQIDAFTAAIKYATEGKKICFNQYFIELLQQEESNNYNLDNSNQEEGDKPEEGNSKRLNYLGFRLVDNSIEIKGDNNKTAEQILKEAKKAFQRGYNYYAAANNDEQIKLKHIYNLGS